MSPESRRARPPVLATMIIVLCGVLDALLFAALLDARVGGHAPMWWAAHALAAGTAAAVLADQLVSQLAARSTGGAALPRRHWFGLCFCLNLALPLAGIIGTSLALPLGIRAAGRRHHGEQYWQFTPNPALPFTTPIGREGCVVDGRGLAERLAYSSDGPSLYRQVLAAGRMRSSLSIDALRDGVRHADERIRLTAYQTLDRKSSGLNDEIDRLSTRAVTRTGRERSDTWLQVASNYWELLTLEQDEPVAREQLLARAGEAALHAIIALPENRNAHFTFGRIALRQGDATRADIAFTRAQALGMPASTILPYRAEAAFVQRDLSRVQRMLGELGEAFKAYPPLKQVAEQWQ